MAYHMPIKSHDVNFSDSRVENIGMTSRLCSCAQRDVDVMRFSGKDSQKGITHVVWRRSVGVMGLFIAHILLFAGFGESGCSGMQNCKSARYGSSSGIYSPSFYFHLFSFWHLFSTYFLSCGIVSKVSEYEV